MKTPTLHRARRMVALLLAMALLLGLAATPALAAFPDIKDEKTQAAAALLQNLGIVDGFKNGTFRPNDTLTRAQFCKIALLLSGVSDVSGYTAFALFPDVTAKHWALGYVNAASREKKLMQGFSDGRFRPDNPVTYAQAVTVLMRLLGYTDEDVGLLWPQSYLSRAAAIGLTKGLSFTQDQKLTRGAMVLLGAQMLTTKTKAGAEYMTSLGIKREDGVILLSTSETAPDGVTKGLLVSGGKTGFVPLRAAVDWTVGAQGSLLTDATGYALTFTPNKQTRLNLTISSVSATTLSASNGTTYKNIAASMPVFESDAEVTWRDVWADMQAGQSITLYLNAQGVPAYAFWRKTDMTGRTRLMETAPGANPLSSLGIPADARVYRDGVLVNAQDLRQWDVVTYNEGTRTAYASGFHITAAYERATPSRDDPKYIQILGGQTFAVTESAQKELLNFTLGDAITVFFSAAGEVAAVRPTSTVLARVTGVMASDTLVLLPNGITIEGKPFGSYYPVGSLVNACVREIGTLSLEAYRNVAPAADLSFVTMRVGDAALSPTAQFFDRSSSTGAAAVIDALDLPLTIPRASILSAETDASGRVVKVVTNNLTGNALAYGYTTYTPEVREGTGFDTVYTPPYLDVYTADGTLQIEMPSPLQKPDIKVPSAATPVAVAWSPGLRFESVTPLSRLATVRRGDFSLITEEHGTGQNVETTVLAASFTIGAVTYRVAPEMKVYVPATKKFLTLPEARAAYSQFDVYTLGENSRVVRMIVVRL